MRITQRMWQNSMLRTMGSSYQRMAETDLIRRIHKPSDDPAGTEQMIRLNSLLSRNRQYQKNVESANRWLTYSESALTTITQNFRDVRTIALSAADDGHNLDGLAEELDGIIDQIMAAANTRHGGRYLFSGGEGSTLPFEIVGNDVIYHGDGDARSVAISEGLSLQYNIPGSDVLTSTQGSLEAKIDWNPAATWSTRTSELFDGEGASMGKIRITDGGGTQTVVDLTGSQTLADIRDRIQASNPNLSVSLDADMRIEIRDPANPGESISIEDLQGGMTARTLGIAGVGAGGVLISKDLDPALTDATLLTDLRGITPPFGSIDVTVGDAEDPTTLDLSGATTVGELRALLNGAFPELNADISPNGNRLRIEGSNNLRFEIANTDGDGTAEALGLTGTGRPTRPIAMILELREAINDEDRDRVRELIFEIDLLENRILSARASAGSRLKMSEDTLTVLQSRNIALTEAVSEIGDADMAEALMRYQSAESVYQATLSMAANIFQMSLVNYL